MEFLQELNERQKEAVYEEHPRVCVIAGPGCGKTKTLVSRLIYLLSSQKAQPRNILTLTFVLDSLLTYTEKLHLPLQVKIENLTRTNSFY